MIRINLLRDPSSQPAAKVPVVRDEPVEVIKKEVKTMSESTGKSTPIVGILMFFIVTCLGGGGYYFWLKGQVETEEERNQILDAEKKELDPFIKLEERFRAQKESLEKKEEALTKLKKRQQAPVKYWEELYNCLQDNIGFVKLTEKGQKFEITGESPTVDGYYSLEANIKRSQLFSNVTFVKAQQRAGNVAIYDFTITFDLTNP